MGQSTRRQIKYRQKIKRRANRAGLKKKNLNPEDFFATGICIKPLRSK